MKKEETKQPTAEEQLIRSAFHVNVATENGSSGSVRWLSDEYVTLSSALTAMESYKDGLRKEIEGLIIITNPESSHSLKAYNKVLSLLDKPQDNE